MSLNARPLGKLLLTPFAAVTVAFYWLRYKLSRRSPAGHPASVMSMNDPQWGKRPNNGKNEGPPDLDEIVRKFNQKIGALFGKKPVGPNMGDGGSGSGPSKAAMSSGVVLAIGLAISVWLASGFYVVDPASKAVELRLGRFKAITEPGLRWHWPYPIESKEVVNVSQVEAIEVGYRGAQKTRVPEESLMLTEDQNIVDVQFAVQYITKLPDDFLFKNNFVRKDPREVVTQVAETAMREIVGKSKMDFVLYEGRADISARAKVLMQSLLDRYRTGIQVAAVTMQNAQPPEQVQESFNDVVRAGQFRTQLKNEGEAYANDILPKARGNAARAAEEAEGYKQRVIATALGDVDRFTKILAEYEKAPGVTRERIYLDTMQQIMQNASKVMVDQKSGQNLLYLPLDKIMQLSPPAAAPVADTTRLTPQVTQPANPVITPDSGRSRPTRP
jgi:membrane protease subunit HflK